MNKMIKQNMDKMNKNNTIESIERFCFIIVVAVTLKTKNDKRKSKNKKVK